VPESAPRGPVLLAIAREAIADAREREGPGEWPHDWLRATAASFVTLRLAGELRGCIGTVDAHRPLGDDVARNARSAAYRDVRFAPLTMAQRSLIDIEVSVLSPRCAIPAESEDDAAACLRPGVDGVVLEFSELRATFLPQVWENLPDPLDFLAELRRKARLPARFWHPDLRISRYTVEKYLSPTSGAWDR
jgi:AmmeMemoRadiSam system protein A